MAGKDVFVRLRLGLPLTVTATVLLVQDAGGEPPVQYALSATVAVLFKVVTPAGKPVAATFMVNDTVALAPAAKPPKFQLSLPAGLWLQVPALAVQEP